MSAARSVTSKRRRASSLLYSCGSLGMAPDHPIYRSKMEKRSEYVQTLGMILIEFNQLEVMLSRLLGYAISVPYSLADILYFTAKNNIARIEILENIVLHVLENETSEQKKILKIVKRAKAIAGKRHALIHSIWVANLKHVYKSSLPQYKTPYKKKEVNIAELTDLIRDIRILVIDVVNTIKLGDLPP